jgi:hypothetical protein
MRPKVHTDDGSCDVGHDEPPREVPAERHPSVGVDGSAISSRGRSWTAPCVAG